MDDIFAVEASVATEAPAVAGDALQAAADAVGKALETTAFMLAEPATTVELRDAALRRVSLCFGGPAAGTLELWTDLALGRSLAANMLGCDGDAPDAVAVDALRELANVAAGAMMPRLVELAAPEQLEVAECPLDLPHIEPVEADAFEQIARQSDGVVLEVEGSPLVVRLA